MQTRKNNLFLIIGIALIGVVMLPVTIFFFQERQQTQSQADKTVLLSFEPTSSTAPLQITAGSTISLDVFVEPGGSSVSFVKTEIVYDATKFVLAGGFIPDQKVFSQIVEGPVMQPGKVTTTLSVGSDTAKALKNKTKIGTLSLKALANVQANSESEVSFGPNSQALALSGNSSFDENVIANTTPAKVKFTANNLVCGNSSTDVMLIFDRSGSMNEKDGTSTKLANAKIAANNFVDILAKSSNNRAGLSTFANSGRLDNPLTLTLPDVKTDITAIRADGGTCIECGIVEANKEITAKKRQGVKNVVVLLTDGEANYVVGNNNQVSQTTAEQRALAAAKSGYTANGTIFFTIGLGKTVNSTFLTTLAESAGGQYYYSPTAAELDSIYTQISQIIAKGSVSGSVFNDANSNGVFEPTEPKLPGVVLELFPLNSQQPQLLSTDSTGNFMYTGLCDGTYTVKQSTPTGWKQTMPSDPRGYTFTITSSTAVSDRNFGNANLPRCSDEIDNDGNGAVDDQDSTCHTDGNIHNPGSYDPKRDGERGNSTCSDSKDNNGNGLIDGLDPVCHKDGNANNPSSYDATRDEFTPTNTPTPTPTPTNTPTPTPTNTPTPTPAGTRFSVDVLMHGIGNGGDNTNPLANSLSNKEPLHATRSAKAEIFNNKNEFVATASGEIQYSSASGSFKGILRANMDVPTGNYTIKFNTGYHLTRLVPGIQAVVDTATKTLPQIDVIAGDANNDNQLDILDYNLLLGCYSDLAPATSCDVNKKLATDSNDDGNVNQIDYNLFLREISNQPGE